MLIKYVFLFPAHWMNNAGEEKYAILEYVFLKVVIHHVVQDCDARIEYVFLKDAIHHVVQD